MAVKLLVLLSLPETLITNIRSLRSILSRRRNVDVLLDEVTAINSSERYRMPVASVRKSYVKSCCFKSTIFLLSIVRFNRGPV